MPYVPVPKDMTKVKTKVVLNLTKRQLICFGAAAAIGVPTYFLTRGIVGNSVAVLFMIGMMLPAFFMAMYEKDGMPAERILLNILRCRLFAPGKRPYKIENFYEYLENQKEGQFVRKDTNTKPAAKPAAGKAPAKKAGVPKC
ncbi:MAG: PrgI family protein [Firmicutes bacterium]|nr:PrgI family protein [Bacillota bacterium]